MGCTKHPQRKRNDCPECFPPRQVIPKVEEVKAPVKKKSKISQKEVTRALENLQDSKAKATEEKLEKEYDTKVSKVVYKPNITISSSQDIDREIRIEVSRVREYVDNCFSEAFKKLQQDVNAIKNLRWEHLHIPLSSFDINLMNAMAQDGWKYCDMVRNPKQYGFPETEDFVIVQRIIKPDNGPTPDFKQPGAKRKYLEKRNGR